MTGIVLNTNNYIRSVIEIEKWLGTYLSDSKTGKGSIVNKVKQYTIYCSDIGQDSSTVDSPVTPFPESDQTSQNLDYHKLIGNTGYLNLTFNVHDIDYKTDSEYSTLRGIDSTLPTDKRWGLSHVKPEESFRNANNLEPVNTSGDFRDFAMLYLESTLGSKYYINIYDKLWGADINNNSRTTYRKRPYEGILVKQTIMRNKGNSPVIYNVVLQFLIGKDIVIDQYKQEDEGNPNG